ncbi:unnamed protein product [Symbiodinium sp. KB8]|nr:unnamed protein product [Symbiodinium sp. KB8]
MAAALTCTRKVQTHFVNHPQANLLLQQCAFTSAMADVNLGREAMPQPPGFEKTDAAWSSYKPTSSAHGGWDDNDRGNNRSWESQNGHGSDKWKNDKWSGGGGGRAKWGNSNWSKDTDTSSSWYSGGYGGLVGEDNATVEVQDEEVEFPRTEMLLAQEDFESLGVCKEVMEDVGWLYMGSEDPDVPFFGTCCPFFLEHLSRGASGQDRVKRAWLCGCWAREILEGRSSRLRLPSPLPLASRFYAAPPVFQAFPSELECRVYLEALAPAEAGEIELLVLDPGLDPALEECFASPCACYCVLKRPGGFLLAVPANSLDEAALLAAEEAGFAGVVGPSKTTLCKAVSWTDTGEWAQVYPSRQVPARLVDLEAAAAPSLSPLLGATVDFQTFDADDPSLYPLAVELVATAYAWLRARPGDRGASGYVTAVEDAPAGDVPADPLLRRAKAKAQDGRGKRPTLAGLAAQQANMQELMASLVDQVQALAQKQGKDQPAAQEAACVLEPPPPPGLLGKPGRLSLASPIFQTLPGVPAKPKRLADILGPPPPVRAPLPQPALEDLAVQEEVLPGITGDELQHASSEPLAQAMLLQAKALTSLVGQLASGSADPLLEAPSGSSGFSTRGTTGRLKIQSDLGLRDGSFFDKVLLAATRRMDPTALPGASAASSGRDTGIMTQYLERFGGYPKDRVLGLIQWQVGIALDLFSRGESKGAADTIALLAVFIEQTSLDNSPDLAWLLTHLPDPPNGLFLDRATTPTTTLRPFSPLADQKLVATTLAYVKELDTMSLKRSEFPKAKHPPKPPLKKDFAIADQDPALSRKQLRAKLWAAKKDFLQQTPEPFFFRCFAKDCPDSDPCSSRKARLISRLVERCVHICCMALNAVHAGGREIPLSALRRLPNPAQRKVVSRVKQFVLASTHDGGDFPLAAGRRGAHALARLDDLQQYLFANGIGPEAYAGCPKTLGRVTCDNSGAPSLEPYRDALASRLLISGHGHWDISPYLNSELLMPFREPATLRGIPANALPFPDTVREDRKELLKVFSLWDQLGLLTVTPAPPEPRSLCRVFGAFKSATRDRMIGDRRGPNGLEGRVLGVSQSLPQGSLLCLYSVAPGHVLCGASTDRSDYYHQIKVTSSRACSNAVGPPLKLSKFEGTSAYRNLLKLGVAKLGSSENCRLGRSGRRAFNLGGGDPLVCGAFSSLFQGDHAGVEFATCGHENLLRDFHLLDSDSRFVAGRPPPLTDVADALVIDDYFSICQLPASSLKDLDSSALEKALAESPAADCIRRAKAAYATAQLSGSDHKDNWGSLQFTVAGAEVNSSLGLAEKGSVLVAAPLHKRLALSFVTLKMTELPAVSEALASTVLGSWVSYVQFRKPFSCFLDAAFGLAAKDSCAESSLLKPLSRRAAGELSLLAACAPLIATNVAVPFDKEAYCTDASLAKGAVCRTPVDPALSEALWHSGPRKAPFAALVKCESGSRKPGPLEAAELDVSQPDLSPEKGLSKPLGLDYDFLEFFGTEGKVSKAVSGLGLRQRARSIYLAIPAGTFSRLPTLRGALSFLKKPAARFVSGVSLLGAAGRGLSFLTCHLLRPETAYPLQAPPGFSTEDTFDVALARVFGLAIASSSRAVEQQKAGLESVLVDDFLLTSEWEVLSSWTWTSRRHINELESNSVLALYKRLALAGGDVRSSIITDSSVVLGSHTKGRSSAKVIRRSLQRAGCTIIAGGLYPSVLFGPTRWNAADDPSRDAELRAPSGTSLNKGLSREELRGLSSLKMLTRPRANWLRLALLLHGSFYSGPTRLVSSLRAFPSEARFLALPEVSPSDLFQKIDFDSTLGFPGEGPSFFFAWLFAFLLPWRTFGAAWDLAFTWLAEEPSNHHIALPPLLLMAILGVCLAWGWLREAGIFSLAWGALLRISEATSATRRHLVMPEDTMWMQSFILVCIDQPKTRGRAAKHQAAKLEPSDLVELVTLAFGKLDKRRGRWASHKVMEIYLQEVASSTFVSDLSTVQLLVPPLAIGSAACSFGGIGSTYIPAETPGNSCKHVLHRLHADRSKAVEEREASELLSNLRSVGISMALKSGVFASFILASSLSCTVMAQRHTGLFKNVRNGKDSVVNTTSEPDQNTLNVQIEKLQAWNFSQYAKCAVRQRPLSMRELPFPEEEYVVLAERALKIWYAAILAQPTKNYSHNEELDLVWHCHILDTRNYADFQQQLGIEIGHRPLPHGDEETNDLTQAESVLQSVSFLPDAKRLNTFFRGCIYHLNCR